METEATLPKNVTRWKDRHGKIRYRFRKTGQPTYYFRSRPGTVTFQREHEQVLQLASVGELSFAAQRMRVQRRPRAARAINGECVYFIGGERGPVKIGTAIDVNKRLAALQTAHPFPLKVLTSISGGRELEAYFHVRFGAHRIGGEWFTRCDEIDAEITLLRKLRRNGGSR